MILQQRIGTKRKWSVSGTGKIKKNGTCVLKDKPSTPGSRQYRVVKPAGDGFTKGTSSAFSVQVFKWTKLAAFTRPGASSNVVGYGTTAIVGTKSFYSSLRAETPGTPAYVEYTVGRRCTDLRTTYALDDSSATGSTGSIKLTVDNVVKTDQALVVGQVIESTTDLTDAFRLRYDFTSNDEPKSVPVVATPEVLCTI